MNFEFKTIDQAVLFLNTIIDERSKAFCEAENKSLKMKWTKLQFGNLIINANKNTQLKINVDQLKDEIITLISLQQVITPEVKIPKSIIPMPSELMKDIIETHQEHYIMKLRDARAYYLNSVSTLSVASFNSFVEFKKILTTNGLLSLAALAIAGTFTALTSKSNTITTVN